MDNLLLEAFSVVSKDYDVAPDRQHAFFPAP